jgi:hypothetical protein
MSVVSGKLIVRIQPQKGVENRKQKRSYMNDPTEITPKSRKYPLGTGRIPSDLKMTAYIELFLNCRLNSYGKLLLLYFAHRYNFKLRTPTKMGSRRAANDLGISKKTYLKYRDQLQELGWIEVNPGTGNNPSRVVMLIGNEISDLGWPEVEAKRQQLQDQQNRWS